METQIGNIMWLSAYVIMFLLMVWQGSMLQRCRKDRLELAKRLNAALKAENAALEQNIRTNQTLIDELSSHKTTRYAAHMHQEAYRRLNQAVQDHNERMDNLGLNEHIIIQL